MELSSSMKLYNTLSRKLEQVKPLDPPKVTLYTCGPTVYQEPHIGNWRTFLFYDTLHRVLTYKGFEVDHVLNITDVGHLTGDSDDGEDKLAAQAKKERKTAWEVAKVHTQQFEDGLERLNIVRPNQLPKATDHIEEQIKLIMKLEDKGFTYETSDGVYFDTSKFKGYGKLAGIKVEEQMAGARVQHNPEKRQHTDFALWKFSPEDSKRDMEWPSPWGKGFPGWHLECSAMAIKYLGETIDIHGGGVDHIGVHHSNEIAQSEGATGKPFANIWIHAEHMLIDNQKMSKSIGNIFTLKDIEQQAGLLVFRLLMLSSHYRSQQNFTWKALRGAQNNLLDIYAWSDLHLQSEGEEIDLAPIENALYDDLNTPQALAALNQIINSGKAPNRQALEKLDSLFGLKLLEREDITDNQKQLIKDREEARIAKNFEEADKIRKQLQHQDLAVDDSDNGPRWRRTKL